MTNGDHHENLVKWNEEQENLAIQWGERAAGYIWLHNKSSNHYGKRRKMIGVPSIFFASLSSLGTAINFNSNPSLYIKIINLVSSFGTLLLTTLASFLKYSEEMESHRNMAKEFSAYSRSIETQLSFSNADRDNPKDFLKEYEKRFNDLIAKAPDIPDKIINEFSRNFKNDGIARPLIVNAMSRIVAYESTPSSAGLKTPKSPISSQSGLFTSISRNTTQLRKLSRDVAHLSQEMSHKNLGIGGLRPPVHLPIDMEQLDRQVLHTARPPRHPVRHVVRHEDIEMEQLSQTMPGPGLTIKIPKNRLTARKASLSSDTSPAPKRPLSHRSDDTTRAIAGGSDNDVAENIGGLSPEDREKLKDFIFKNKTVVDLEGPNDDDDSYSSTDSISSSDYTVFENS